MKSIRKIFNICIVTLMMLISTCQLAAVAVPSRISGPPEILHSEFAIQLQRTMQWHSNYTIAFILLIWILAFMSVLIAGAIKDRV